MARKIKLKTENQTKKHPAGLKNSCGVNYLYAFCPPLLILVILLYLFYMPNEEGNTKGNPKGNTEENTEEKQRRFDAMKAVSDQLVALKAPLADERRANKVFPVIGEGSHMAKLMFIGEAPGKNEAVTGRPFCGASGKFLSELLAGIGVAREDVYITNIVKDRPTDNRDPSPEEIAEYGPFLDRQIEIIQPKAIITLGRFSMQYIMTKLGLELELGPISKLHGKIFYAPMPYGDEESLGAVAVIPLYHPAAALYNGGMRSTLAEDFKVIKSVL